MTATIKSSPEVEFKEVHGITETESDAGRFGRYTTDIVDRGRIADSIQVRSLELNRDVGVSPKIIQAQLSRLHVDVTLT